MVRISNAVVAAVNGFFFLIGISLIGVGIYFIVHPAVTTCQRALQQPLVILGLVTSVVSMLGIIGSAFKKNHVLIVYLIHLVVFIASLAFFTSFLFMKTSRGHEVHHVEDYSTWLRNHFAKGKNWDIFKGCLADAKICEALAPNLRTKKNAPAFVQKKLSRFQVGCCRPPAECGFKKMNATFWIIPKSGSSSNDTDCRLWSNNPKDFCYNCNSCKEGSLAVVRKQWRTMAILSLSLLVFISFFFCFGWYATNNNRYDKITRSSNV